MTKEELNGPRVCSICMSTSNLSPYPAFARPWLHSITGGKALISGVCSLCNAVLRRSVRFWERVRVVQETLLKLVGKGELNTVRVKEINSTAEQRPFLNLSTRYFSCYDYEYEHMYMNIDGNTEEQAVDIKSENSFDETNDSLTESDDNSLFDDSDKDPLFIVKDEDKISNVISDSDNPVKVIKKTNNINNETTDEECETSERNVLTNTNRINEVLADCNNIIDKENETTDDENATTGDEIQMTDDEKETTDVESEACDKDIAQTMVNGSDQALLIAELSRNLNERLEKYPIQKPSNEKINEYFEIEAFTLKEQKNEMLKRKIFAADYENSTFKCERCYQGFMEQEEYDKHLTEHKQEAGLTCRVCLRQCANSFGFVKHIVSHFQRWIFTCKVCDFRTTISKDAKLHISMHEGKTYECGVCKRSFSKKKSYYAHMQLKHASQHACALCGLAFSSAWGVQCHRARRHRHEQYIIPPNGPECEECNIRFKNEAALAVHMRRSPKHGGGSYSRGRPPLSQFPPLTSDPRDFRRARASQQPVECEQCGRSLPGPHAYRYHFLREHPASTRTQFFDTQQRSLCSVCGTSVVNLARHMAKHSKGSHACERSEECGKTFGSRSAALNHQETHREPRHTCPTCGKRFNERGNLNRHFSYAHTTVRDVKCDYCEKLFKSIPEMNAHMNHVHLKIPWPRKRHGEGKVRRGATQGDSIEPNV